MDPSLLHTTSARTTSTSSIHSDIKPSFEPGSSSTNAFSTLGSYGTSSNLNSIPIQGQSNNQPSPEASTPSDEDDDERTPDGVKRPRLRLAHACDRCRKRKIRCDTQQPCGPCQATRNECTFNTPSRRVTKPKVGSENRSSSTSGGVKRPHSPPGSARIAALGGEGQANLEARLAALEAMLGDVPPKVHNAFLSSLDARLGSGGGVGISQGKGEGVGVALEALAGGDLTSLLSGLTEGKNGDGWEKQLAGMSRGRSKGGEDLVESMAKKMEGMSFFYEDEIGQAKWQGKS